MPDTECGTYPIHLPPELCDRLAVQADRIKVFVNFCEGRQTEIREKLLRWKEYPILSERERLLAPAGR